MAADSTNRSKAGGSCDRQPVSAGATGDRQQFKRPESVLVVVCTTGGEVLMLERRQPAGFWQSVTGSLEWRETPLRAAERELYEETGLRAGGRLMDLRHTERFRIVPPWQALYARTDRFNTEHWYVLRLEGRRLIRLQSSEHRNYRWVPAARAARMAFSWTNRRAIERYVDREYA